jgi:hypothetical protein
VGIVSRRWRTPARDVVEFRSAAVETLAVGVPEEDVAGKQDGAVFNLV